MATTSSGLDGGMNLQQGFNNIYSMFGPTQSGSGSNTNIFGGSQPIGQGTNLSNISSGSQPNNPLFGNTPITGGYQNQPMSGAGSPFGVAPQPMSGSDNSLTAFFRGLSNLLGTTAPSFIQAGENLIQGGLGPVQTGLGQQGTGFQTTQQALNTMAPAINYQNAILSGDPTRIAAAVGPQAQNLATIYGGAMNNASQGMPAGGFRALSMANLPQAQAQQVGNMVLGLQPQAAAALQQAGPQISGIGAQQAGIGQGTSQTGLGVSNLGANVANLGFQNVQNAISDLLQKMGYNIQGGTSNTFKNFAQGIGALLGGSAAGAQVGSNIYGSLGPTTGLTPV